MDRTRQWVGMEMRREDVKRGESQENEEEWEQQRWGKKYEGSQNKEETKQHDI